MNDLLQLLTATDLPDPTLGLSSTLDMLEDALHDNSEALAAFDIAVHDLFGKLSHTRSSELYQVPDGTIGSTMYTIATNDPEEIQDRVAEAPAADLLKIKLTGTNDAEKLRILSRIANRPLFLDVNQGWSSMDSYDSIKPVLEECDVAGLEQPFGIDEWDMHEQLKNSTSIPIYADESFENMDDMESVKRAFSGINVKLMKCGGIRNALRIIDLAKENSMRIMLGSMSESSCGTAAAMQLGSMVDLLDQDGPLLLSNDPFRIIGGSGLGIEPIETVAQAFDIR